jgi:hypothetical protein
MGGLEPSIAEEEPNPFDCFESCAELLAFIHKTLGTKFVRECFSNDLAKPLEARTNREFLEDQGDELNRVGLHKLAKIVLEYAAKAPSRYDLVFCRYEPGTASYRDWVRRARRKWQTHTSTGVA